MQIHIIAIIIQLHIPIPSYPIPSIPLIIAYCATSVLDHIFWSHGQHYLALIRFPTSCQFSATGSQASTSLVSAFTSSTQPPVMWNLPKSSAQTSESITLKNQFLVIIWIGTCQIGAFSRIAAFRQLSALSPSSSISQVHHLVRGFMEALLLLGGHQNTANVWDF